LRQQKQAAEFSILEPLFRCAAQRNKKPSNEKSIVEIRVTALNEMIQEAQSLGANALIGVTLDIEMLSGDSLILCKGYATAVIIK